MRRSATVPKLTAKVRQIKKTSSVPAYAIGLISKNSRCQLCILNKIYENLLISIVIFAPL